jgi:hypothetical protein
MIKLLIKLAIVALLANAGLRIATEYLVHYQFRDSVREAAIYRARNDQELRETVMEMAAQQGVPLTADAFTVRRDEREANIQGTYVKAIEVVPGYPYDWKFDFTIQAYISPVPPLPGAPQRRTPLK